jgi:putative ABC transport system substrate-binding protein
MDRRMFLGTLAGSLLAAPLAAEAQEIGKTPRIGYLLPSPARRSNEEFVAGLRSLGYMEGRNIFIERRYAEGRPERYRQLATELVQLHVDVMVADGSAATRAAKAATTRIPIVMIAADPIGSGFITTLNRPGQNVTGLSTNSPALIGKRLELLRESESAAQALGLRTVRAPVRGVEQLDTAFGAIVSSRADAILLIEKSPRWACSSTPWFRPSAGCLHSPDSVTSHRAASS